MISRMTFSELELIEIWVDFFYFFYCSLLLCKTDKETLIHLFWECSVTKTFWGRVHCFFVSIHLILASHVLDIYEYLGFRGEKDDILVSHCLLLARYYIHFCKFKNISPSIREYAQQRKNNMTNSQNKYQQKWRKILHAL